MFNINKIERSIVETIIDKALEHGYKLLADVGHWKEEWDSFPASDDKEHILNTMFREEREWLFFYKETKRKGFVQLIYSNDELEIIVDYSTSLCEVFDEVNKTVKKEQ